MARVSICDRTGEVVDDRDAPFHYQLHHFDFELAAADRQRDKHPGQRIDIWNQRQDDGPGLGWNAPLLQAAIRSADTLIG